MCWYARPAANIPRQGSQRPAGTSGRAAGCEVVFSTGGLHVLIRIEQPMQMHDEVAHMGVVYGLLRLRPPRCMGRGVIREQADDFHLIEILEGRMFEIGEFTADHEMKQLLRGTIRHDCLSWCGPGRLILDETQNRSRQ